MQETLGVVGSSDGEEDEAELGAVAHPGAGITWCLLVPGQAGQHTLPGVFLFGDRTTRKTQEIGIQPLFCVGTPELEKAQTNFPTTGALPCKRMS